MSKSIEAIEFELDTLTYMHILSGKSYEDAVEAAKKEIKEE